MYRVDNPSAAATLPVAAPVGVPGYFQDGDPLTAVEATIVDQDWVNDKQEELCGFVEAVGIVLSKASRSLFVQAVRRFAGANVTNINASGTLTADEAGILLINATAGNIAITLPPAAQANGTPIQFRFFRTDNTANTASIALHAGDTWSPGALTAAQSLAGLDAMAIASDGVSTWLPFSRARRGSQLFTISGSFTVPFNVTLVTSTVWGGGGGSMASSGAGDFTNGGASGGFSRGQFIVTPGAVITVPVGTGGSNSASGTPGGNGLSSSFGAFNSATGGTGASSTIGLAAAPGVGLGGSLNLGGNSGAPAVPGEQAGNGGAGLMYGASSLGGQSTAVAGGPFGGGASGVGASGGGGQIGASGAVLVEW